ncbi:hypothetical protein WAI453_012049 [Rhynchosporium graminicola]
MATLDELKQQLRKMATATPRAFRQPLSDSQYSVGFDLLRSGSTEYEEFIIPQLSQLIGLLLKSRSHISVLEIGPGPESVLVHLPNEMRQKIKKYVAYEPNSIFVPRLLESLSSTKEDEAPLPGLRSPPTIHEATFDLNQDGESNTTDNDRKYDLVILCHSMYGMKKKRQIIERSLGLLGEQPEGGLVVVFHRSESLDFEQLVFHQTAFFPTGISKVADDDETLDKFASFVAGFTVQEADQYGDLRTDWRETCRNIGHRKTSLSKFVSFSSPNIMVAFTRHAMALPELLAQVPMVSGDFTVKSREARTHRPACVMGPKNIRQVQDCVQWAIKHKLGLTVIGGGHSGHCILPNIVCVDMSAFDKICIVEEPSENLACGSNNLAIVESGCQTGDIIRTTMEAGLTVPLGARPSVGAGLWLQGGIGHLARFHGLACDSIIGAVVVSMSSGQIFCVGNVPKKHRPVGSIQPEKEEDLLWALKGAGTNFGIVISVTFKTYPARTYALRNWVTPLHNNEQAVLKIAHFGKHVSESLPQNSSADAYLYWEADQLRLGITVFESCTVRSSPVTIEIDFEPGANSKAIDGVALFESEMYMSAMHGGHGGGKTSSFKRCLLLKRIGDPKIAKILISAIKERPGPLCYLHLLHGGGAVSEISTDATAFGCRDWDFACVVTGTWPRDRDGTEVARAAVDWVYEVSRRLLPVCSGVYGADLGPDPRDASLAALAFGSNRPRLARLKQIWDPHNVLAYACPIPNAPVEAKLIILVTGESCAGKDYCADAWTSLFVNHIPRTLKARSVSISDTTKRDYATVTGANFERLLTDRVYKEIHRPALTRYFSEQVKQRPHLLEEHFMKVVYENADVDVLLVTGMREYAPVAMLSHLVPDSRLLDVRVQASRDARVRRGGFDSGGIEEDVGDTSTGLGYRPSFTFDNAEFGSNSAESFAEKRLLPALDSKLRRLSDMIQCTPDFPRPGIDFRHVLDICQQPTGLPLCTSLLENHFSRKWKHVDNIVCCEAGGFVFASALAALTRIPLALIRVAGKLPPPTISVIKTPSHISSLVGGITKADRIEIGRDVVAPGATVVVVDDVLATGRTLVAVSKLLVEAGVKIQDISIMVVAEFPMHEGRRHLYESGFGGVEVRSLLVFGGA